VRAGGDWEVERVFDGAEEFEYVGGGVGEEDGEKQCGDDAVVGGVEVCA